MRILSGTPRDFNLFMLRLTLSVNCSAKHESHCPSGFYKVILLHCWDNVPTSTVYSFSMEKVKAQGGGQTPDVTHPVSTKFTPCTWIVSQRWHVTGKENGSIPGNPSVSAFSVQFSIQLSLQSNKLHQLYTCCMQNILLSLEAVAAQKYIYSCHHQA